MREVDRIMVEELHIELVQVMENAGGSLAELAICRFGPHSVTVLAGKGATAVADSPPPGTSPTAARRILHGAGRGCTHRAHHQVRRLAAGPPGGRRWPLLRAPLAQLDLDPRRPTEPTMAQVSIPRFSGHLR
jgi:hypothetical protein